MAPATRTATKAKSTLAEVARLAGVSAPTVSKVVNGRDDVAPETREKVLAALAKVGYSSPAQRRVAAPGPDVVEVALDALTSAYTTDVLTGILDYAAVAGVEVMVSVTGGTPSAGLGPERRAQRMLDQGRAGLIVVTSAFSEAQLSAFRRHGIPVVVIDPQNPPPSDVVSVGATNWAGGKAAAEHLVALGHERIGYLGGPEGAECNQARLHGYMSVLMSHGIAVRPECIVHGKFRSEHGIEGLKRLLSLPERPTAIFAASDSIAVGVLREARRQGIRVPEDLSLVGFDGTAQAEDAVPALTSVSQPLQKMGRSALRSVLRQAHGEPLDSHRVELATELVVRESTAPPAASDPARGSRQSARAGQSAATAGSLPST
ncbi:LacI family DNA-binding transcriptional regulator [Sinomonas sp. R1AF57]|uniref:LacI family DNA-binding transcriptional regulator n=1 Tax=Sinomonas sp. R1AF57 TaxID=2020377 RepID=UPI000B6118D1|nr:LacI family DNA-binding transcriptional regulator [Sinomonas sp. R1AF57]ASN50844.1 LacI family transcriptional regulator [Sinomonas sp. R1AF57]